MTSTSSLSAKVLGQITLMQSVVSQLPDQESMLSFACRGLKDVSGVKEVKLLYDDTDKAQSTNIDFNLDEHIFPIRRNNFTHAHVCLSLSNSSAFSPYIPYIENFCNMLAVVFEELRQREENLALLADLEQRVTDRTAELEREIQERRKTEEMLSYSMSLTNAALEATADGIFIVKKDGKVARWNKRFADLWQIQEDLLNADNATLILQHLTDRLIQPDNFLAKINELSVHPEHSSEDLLHLVDGRIFESYSQPVTISDQIAGRFWSFRNITERKQSEEALRKSEAHLRTLVQTIPDLIWLKDKDGVYLACNSKFERFFGAKQSEIIGKTDYDFVDRELADFFILHDQKAIAAGEPTSNEEWITFADDGSRTLLETIKTPMYDGNGLLSGVLGIGRDITQRKRAEEENTRLEIQLQQAQKMEAIGQLAGGVAHDFNNMLGVILGHTEMAMEEIDPTHAEFKDLEQIRTAANRSTDITRQLLAFARKQTIAPKIIDLNEIVESILKMLRRLIGEDIELVWVPFNKLWPLKMDPTQIDQILANLCVNARRAITGVGKIIVETGNSTFDEEYCLAHANYAPGDYVRLTVSDNGCGISQETMPHIFEPFFTTKDVGEGTGLGLATVYGAIKQNFGFINVYSELSLGTTFTIYFPRYRGDIGEARVQGLAEPVAGGKETILLVEDEQAILLMTKAILQRLGYTVMTASRPDQALKIIREFSQQIDLLITDVIMPQMNGRDLSEKLIAEKSNLKCLFMSGYTADIITKQGIIDEKMCFIQKPFSKADLAIKVRQALDSGPY